MSKIKLTQNKYAIVDAKNLKALNNWKWCYHLGYAVSNYKKRTVYMHRLINKTPDGFVTDHRDRNKLNNRESNLRTVTHTQNHLNTKLYNHNTTRFKGVVWSKRDKKWDAQIQINGKHISLGRFLILSEAIKARKLAEKRFF